MEQRLTFQFGVLWQPLVVHQSRLLQTPVDHSFDIFLWNRGDDISHQNLERKVTERSLTNTRQCVQWSYWNWEVENGCFRETTYPFKQGQSCFQCSLWPSKWEAVSVEKTKWIFILNLQQSGRIHSTCTCLLWFGLFFFYLKCVIWFSRSTRSLSLISSKRSFSSTVTVPIPSGLKDSSSDMLSKVLQCLSALRNIWALVLSHWRWD